MALSVWEWLGNNVGEIIAICALAFTAYQAYLSRKHNRISVTPSLATFATRDSENDIGRLGVNLSNNGLGPAVIETYQIELDGTPQKFSDSKDAVEFIQELVGIISIKCTATILSPGHILAASESKTIIHLTFMEDDGKGWKHIEGLIDRLSLRVNYKSMYGEKLTYHSVETHN